MASGDAGTHPIALHLASLQAYYQHAAHASSTKLQGLALRCQLAEEAAERERTIRVALEKEVVELRKRHGAVPLVEDPLMELKKSAAAIDISKSALTSCQHRLTTTTSALSLAKHDLEATRTLLAESRQGRDALVEENKTLTGDRKALQDVVGEYAKLVRKLEARLSAAGSGPSSAASTPSLEAPSDVGPNGWGSWGSSPLTSPSLSGLDITISHAPSKEQAIQQEDVGALKEDITRLQDERERTDLAMEGMRQEHARMADEITSLTSSIAEQEMNEATALQMVHDYIEHASTSQALLHRRALTLERTVDQLDTSLSASHVRFLDLEEAFSQCSLELAREAKARREEVRIRLTSVAREERISRWITRVVAQMKAMATVVGSDPLAVRDAWTTFARGVQRDAETLWLVATAPSTSASVSTAVMPATEEATPLQSLLEDPSNASLARMLLHEGLVVSLVEELDVLQDRSDALERRLSEREGDHSHSDEFSSFKDDASSDRTSGFEQRSRSRRTSLDSAAVDVSHAAAAPQLLPSARISSPIALEASNATPTHTPPRGLARTTGGPYSDVNGTLARLALALDALRSDVAFSAALAPSEAVGQAASVSPAQDLLHITAMLTSLVSELRVDVQIATADANRASRDQDILALLDSPVGQGSARTAKGDLDEVIDATRTRFTQRTESIAADVDTVRGLARTVAAQIEEQQEGTPRPRRTTSQLPSSPSPFKALWSALPAIAASPGNPPKVGTLVGDSMALAHSSPPQRQQTSTMGTLFSDSVALAHSSPPRRQQMSTTSSSPDIQSSAGDHAVDTLAELQLLSLPTWRDLLTEKRGASTRQREGQGHPRRTLRAARSSPTLGRVGSVGPLWEAQTSVAGSSILGLAAGPARRGATKLVGTPSPRRTWTSLRQRAGSSLSTLASLSSVGVD